MRRYDRWLEMAEELGLRPVTVIAVCYFLNKGWSPARAARSLDIPLGVSERIAEAGKPFLRRSTGGPSKRDFLSERDGEKCHYCGTKHYLTIDHIVPICQGGDNDILNLGLACRNCNASKGGRTPEEWLA